MKNASKCASKARGKHKRTAVAIVGVGFSLVVGLGVVETAARLFSLAVPEQGVYANYVTDAFLPYKPKPSSRLMGRTDEFVYDYRHNSFGFRDVEHIIRKKEGTFRILALGDSFTYGAGVAFEETYLYRLEAMLNRRAWSHPRVEVIKAGMPRYFPEPERLLLEKYGVKFQPDLVLVGFLPNDVVDTYAGLDAVTVDKSGYLMTREAKALGQLGMQIYRYSHFGRLLLRKYVDWRIVRNYWPQEDVLFQSGGFHERDWVKIESEYDKMATVTDSIGAKLVVFHIPQKGPWTEKSDYPATRLSAWAAKRDVDFADLLPAMERASARERLYYERDGHCTPAGHAVIAQELFRHLTDRNLIP